MNFAIIRSLDELGRIVLPKDMRSHFNMNTGDLLQITTTEEGILIKKKQEESNNKTKSAL